MWINEEPEPFVKSFKVFRQLRTEKPRLKERGTKGLSNKVLGVDRDMVRIIKSPLRNVTSYV